jgi:hypothetical protein
MSVGGGDFAGLRDENLLASTPGSLSGFVDDDENPRRQAEEPTDEKARQENVRRVLSLMTKKGIQPRIKVWDEAQEKLVYTNRLEPIGFAHNPFGDCEWFFTDQEIWALKDMADGGD